MSNDKIGKPVKIDKNKLFEVNVIVQKRANCPAVELRTMTSDFELMKLIISCAYHQTPIIIMPKFNNTLRSLASCVDCGILYKDGDEYRFMF